MLTLEINGETQALDIDPAMPLLWALRDHLALTGTKYACGIAQCGSCTVHLDGEPVRSCVTPVSAAQGKRVTTIAGLNSPVGRAVQAVWRELEVVQCGYCQSGQILSAVALLRAGCRLGPGPGGRGTGGRQPLPQSLLRSDPGHRWQPRQRQLLEADAQGRRGGTPDAGHGGRRTLVGGPRQHPGDGGHLDPHRERPRGELADAASSLPVPEQVRLKDPGEFRLIGRRLPVRTAPKRPTARPYSPVTCACRVC